MYQTPFKITPEIIQCISDIAEAQVPYKEKSIDNVPLSVILQQLPKVYRQGHGTGRIPFLMQDLEKWLDKSRDHILIKSCVFLFEMENIRPFQDGGIQMEMDCLKKMLSTWNPIFYKIPLEKLLEENKDNFCKVFQQCNENNDSGEFIAFMMKIVLMGFNTIEKEKNEIESTSVKNNNPLNDLLKIMSENPSGTYGDFALKLKISTATVKRRIASLKHAGFVIRSGSKKTGIWHLVMQP